MAIKQTEKFIRVHTSLMKRARMPEVLQIEQKSFECPWTEEDFCHCLLRRDCLGMIAEDCDKILGFTIYELHKTKIEILNIAVHPDWRRRNIGCQMVKKLIDKLSPYRKTKIVIKIRESNTSAQLFFREIGFRAIQTLINYYQDANEAAYKMVRYWND